VIVNAATFHCFLKEVLSLVTIFSSFEWSKKPTFSWSCPSFRGCFNSGRNCFCCRFLDPDGMRYVRDGTFLPNILELPILLDESVLLNCIQSFFQVTLTQKTIHDKSLIYSIELASSWSNFIQFYSQKVISASTRPFNTVHNLIKSSTHCTPDALPTNRSFVHKIHLHRKSHNFVNFFQTSLWIVFRTVSRKPWIFRFWLSEPWFFLFI
jgi:hypothetical protein